ncbi:nucleoside triphosphate pyrophosphohydrolase [Holdemanella sp. SCCA2]|nr:nucleoside triphosphate pyrophosphohydrolase [Holdemanella sp. SCCA2]
METVYNKLVRDNIPEIIKCNNDGEAVIRILSNEEYKKALEDKLYEEYQEVLESSGEDRVEELADMLEIMISLAKLEKSNLEKIIEIAKKKKAKRGGFDKKLYLEKVVKNN